MEKRRKDLVYQFVESFRIFSQPKLFFKSKELNLAEFMILNLLAETGSCYMKDIVVNFSIAGSTATTIVDRLVRRKYVQREHSTEDRRKVFLKITPEGRHVHTRFWSIIFEIMKGPLSHLTEEEIKTLSTLIKKLVSLINKNRE